MQSMKIKFVFKLSDFLSVTELQVYSMRAVFGEKETYMSWDTGSIPLACMSKCPWARY